MMAATAIYLVTDEVAAREISALLVEARRTITTLRAALESERLAHKATKKELAEAVRALEPFAKRAMDYDKHVAHGIPKRPDSFTTGMPLHDCRRAREIWEKHK